MGKKKAKTTEQLRRKYEQSKWEVVPDMWSGNYYKRKKGEPHNWVAFFVIFGIIALLLWIAPHFPWNQ